MEKLVDTVTTESTDNRESILVRMLLNNLAEIAVSHTRFYFIRGQV